MPRTWPEEAEAAPCLLEVARFPGKVVRDARPLCLRSPPVALLSRSCPRATLGQPVSVRKFAAQRCLWPPLGRDPSFHRRPHHFPFNGHCLGRLGVVVMGRGQGERRDLGVPCWPVSTSCTERPANPVTRPGMRNSVSGDSGGIKSGGGGRPSSPSLPGQTPPFLQSVAAPHVVLVLLYLRPISPEVAPEHPGHQFATLLLGISACRARLKRKTELKNQQIAKII